VPFPPPCRYQNFLEKKVVWNVGPSLVFLAPSRVMVTCFSDSPPSKGVVLTVTIPPHSPFVIFLVYTGQFNFIFMCNSWCKPNTVSSCPRRPFHFSPSHSALQALQPKKDHFVAATCTPKNKDCSSPKYLTPINLEATAHPLFVFPRSPKDRGWYR